MIKRANDRNPTASCGVGLYVSREIGPTPILAVCAKTAEARMAGQTSDPGNVVVVFRSLVISRSRDEVSDKCRSRVGVRPRFSGDHASARAKAHATVTSAGHVFTTLTERSLSPTKEARVCVDSHSATRTLEAPFSRA